MRKGSIVRGLLVLLLFGIALALMFYPFVASYVFENRMDSIVDTIEKTAQDTDDAERKAAIEEAVSYNREIASGHVQLRDPFVEEQLDETVEKYSSQLCMTEDGVMGFIKIPSINVSLPIYHGTSERVLEMGAGHLQGSSLPVGGESTHTVITGHSGLSNAKLFTDLTELEEGDIFFLHVMGEILAYKVDQIKVVLPTETSDLGIETGKDYCTLLTCTPYGVNTHRLLVRGERTDYQETVDNPEIFQAKKVESKWMAEYKRALFISLGCFGICVLVIFFLKRFRGRKKILDDFC